jgi:1,2-diacylglycerol 3-beta-galactosyltransferase
MRRKLGMHASRPAVLLVGGGEGMGALEQTVDEIAAQLGPECQVGDGPAAQGGLALW